MSFWDKKRDDEELATALPEQKPTYTSSWNDQLKTIAEKIDRREPFKFDLNGDVLYQQMKDKAVQQGKLAMGDAMGMASAMTGGYGNSYAQSVGQQTYQKELQSVNDVIPELYQMAYDMDDRKTQGLYDQFAMISALDERDYDRHRDKVSDMQADRSFKYAQERDKISDMLANSQLYWQSEGKSGYDNGGVSEDKIRKMQEQLGVSVTGKWDAGSTGAAKGLSAAEAWEAYQNGTLGKSDISPKDVAQDIIDMYKDGYRGAKLTELLEGAVEDGYINSPTAISGLIGELLKDDPDLRVAIFNQLYPNAVG